MIVVEAGKSAVRFREPRSSTASAALDYGENIWPGDFVEDSGARGIDLTHDGGGRVGAALGRRVQPVLGRRHAPEIDVWAGRGLADRMGRPREASTAKPNADSACLVNRVRSNEDRRSEPYPMPAMPMTYNLMQLKAWAERSGIPFWTTPQAKNTVDGYGGRSICRRCNTCEICPTGARYSPDWTFKHAARVRSDFSSTTRRWCAGSNWTRPAPRVAVAKAATRRRHRRRSRVSRAHVRARGSGYTWSPHLLLLSANTAIPERAREFVGSRRPLHDRPPRVSDDDRSGPAHLPGHERAAQPDLAAVLPVPRRSRRSSVTTFASGKAPAAAVRSCATAKAGLLLGDALLTDWRTRTTRGTARVRGYYDVHPDRDSRLTLDPAAKNRWGDPLPVVRHQVDAATEARSRRRRASLRAAVCDNGEGQRRQDGRR